MEILRKMKEMNFTQWFNYYLGFTSFVVCFSSHDNFPQLIPLTIVGLAVFVIIGYVKRAITFQLTKPIFFLAMFYIAYLIGCFFTKHLDIASKYLEYKLSFLIFPLLLSFKFKEQISLRKSIIGLVLGVVIVSIMGLFHSYELYLKVGDFNNSFGSVRFSYIHHPSYFSVFLTIALVSCWYGYFQKWIFFRLTSVILFSLFSLVMQFFCFSLAGMLFLFILGLVLYIILIYKYLNKVLLIISILLIPIVPVTLYHSNIHVQIEVDSSFSVVKQFIENPVNFVESKKNTVSGSEIRVIMWIVAFQEMKENPLGVGTGNIDDYLSDRLIKYNQKETANHLYNPHNQFLQTGLEIGIFGLILLLLIISSTFYFAYKYKNWILLILIASLAFNSLFESMLQRQSGIIFYSFWICLLILVSRTNQILILEKESK